VTNARFASLHGLPVALLPSTTPVSLRKPGARHERASGKCRIGGGPPSAARGGVALRLRFAKRYPPLSAPLSPLADRRPKPDRLFSSRHPPRLGLTHENTTSAIDLPRQFRFSRKCRQIFTDEHFVVQPVQCVTSQRLVLLRAENQPHGRVFVRVCPMGAA